MPLSTCVVGAAGLPNVPDGAAPNVRPPSGSVVGASSWVWVIVSLGSWVVPATSELDQATYCAPPGERPACIRSVDRQKLTSVPASVSIRPRMSEVFDQFLYAPTAPMPAERIVVYQVPSVCCVPGGSQSAEVTEAPQS